ncbi:hypothetical protein [Paracnuella aquatica]|uniref:hypothetical protein n=1 Tax=Paracnuella aquatica TaxID=2268757 RepID=UPI000DEFEABD|nr:hypothetical protein [Paracnuella aquatica]RPD43399.1 hypothetical protein DRJ53_20365 [Paracnuella aquatica]
MKKISLSLLLLFFFTLSGYSQIFGKLTFSDSKSWIPIDFNPKNYILLIEQYPDKLINEAMIDYLRKNYRGKYEVVGEEKILEKTGIYSDTALYKYAFLWETTNGSDKPTGHFFDRAVGMHYPTTTKNNRYQAKNAYKSYINTIDLRHKK